MSRDIRNGDWVKVTWVDSAGLGHWSDLDVAEKMNVMDCTTIGTLLNRNGNAVRVAQTTDSEGAVIHVIAIPKVSISKITQLVEAE